MSGRKRMNDMKRELIKYAGIGFLIGSAVGNIIALLPFLFGKRELLPVPQTLTEKLGSAERAFLVHTLLSGLLGAVSFAGMLFYERDDWSMIQSAVIHWLLIMLFYFPIALYCGWISEDPREMLIMALIMTAAYVLIWLFMYLRYRKQAEELNRELDRRES